MGLPHPAFPFGAYPFAVGLVVAEFLLEPVAAAAVAVELAVAVASELVAEGYVSIQIHDTTVRGAIDSHSSCTAACDVGRARGWVSYRLPLSERRSDP